MPPEAEKLIVYQKALDAAEAAEVICQRIPATHLALRDQLRRASMSVVLNIAEGAGEYRRPEKARFYRMARRSAAECMAALDLTARILKIPCTPEKATFDTIAAMLTPLIDRG